MPNTPQESHQAWRAALHRKDLDTMMELTHDDVVLYDLAGAPYVGKAAVRALWEKCLPMLPTFEGMEELNVHHHVADGMAVMVFEQTVIKPPEAPPMPDLMRVTIVQMPDEKGVWKSKHEHVSFPYPFEELAKTTQT